MTLPVTIPNTFATQSGNVPVSEVDANFSTLAAVQNDLGTYAGAGTDVGTANAYVINFAAGITVSLTNALACAFVPLNNNTGASTVNVGGTGVLPLLRPNGQPLETGDLATGIIYPIRYSSSTNSWYVQYLNQNFSASLGNPGWEQSPTGKIEQWGSTALTIGSSFGNITFPEPFPNNAYMVSVCIGDNNQVNLTCMVVNSTVSKTGFSVEVLASFSSYSGAARINWFAIGN